jgi:hypothetical protein
VGEVNDAHRLSSLRSLIRVEKMAIRGTLHWFCSGSGFQ